MSLLRVSILLQIIGVIFEGIFASLLFPMIIESGREKIKQFAISFGKLVVPGLGDRFNELVVGSIIVVLFEAVISFGWIKHILWLFIIGIIILLAVLILSIFDKGNKDEKRSSKVIQGFAALFAFLFIPPILIQFVLKLFSLLLKVLTIGGKFIKNLFFIVGLFLIITGLILQWLVSP